MNRIVFLVLSCLFLVQFGNAQQRSKYVDFCGQAYYEVKNGATVLHWKDTCGGVLYYQVHEKKSWKGWAMLDSISGKDTSYILPNYTDSTFRGELYYILAFYKNGKIAKSKEFYIPETQMYRDSVTNSLRIVYDSSKMSRNAQTNSTNRSLTIGYYLDNDNNVVINWMIAPAGMQVELLQIFRNDEIITDLPPDEQTYTDINPGLGSHVYTLQIYYENGMIEGLDLWVEIFPAQVITFGYDLKINNLVLNWEIASNGVLPQFFEIMCNAEHIAHIPAEDEKYTYNYTVPNLEIGNFTYHLHVYYSPNEISIIDIDIDIYFAEIMSFTGSVENFNSVLLQWNLFSNGIRPQSFQIKRNGDEIQTVSDDIYWYFDANLEDGDYSYDFFAHYYDGTIVPANVSIDIIISPITYNTPSNFRDTVVNNDVILTWDTLTDGVSPSFYRIIRNGIVLRDLHPHVYRYYDAYLDTGVHSYSLVAHYINGTALEIGNIDVVISKKIQKLHAPLDSNFKCVTIGNAIELSWGIIEIEADAVPIIFQVERDNEIVKTLNANTFTYFDANLARGNYVYNLLITYQNYPFVVVTGVLYCRVGN